MASIDDSQSTDDTATAADEAETTTAVDDEPSTLSPEDLSGLDVADDHEAAAITAAIAAHLRDRQAAAAAAAAADEDDERESRRTWAFAGRLEAIGETAGRPPNNTPRNGWSAASRADRF